MIRVTSVATALAVLFASPVFAGPCTQRIAELEKAISAKQEGVGLRFRTPQASGPRLWTTARRCRPCTRRSSLISKARSRNACRRSAEWRSRSRQGRSDEQRADRT